MIDQNKEILDPLIAALAAGIAPIDIGALSVGEPLVGDEATMVAIWRGIHGPIPMGRRLFGRFYPFPKPGSQKGHIMKTLSIELGERKFEVPLFTLQQIRDIDIRLRKRGDEAGSNFDIGVDLLEIALRNEMPDMTTEKINELRGTGNQLLTALRRIIAFSNGGTDGEEIAVAAAEKQAAIDTIAAAASGA